MPARSSGRRRRVAPPASLCRRVGGCVELESTTSVAWAARFGCPSTSNATRCRHSTNSASDGLTVIGAVPHQGQPMHDVDLRVQSRWYLAEKAAVSPRLCWQALDLRVSIPMQRPVDSLNVAVAAGVLVYEARRQRG